MPPLLTLSDIALTFGGRPLFEGVSVQLSAGEKICLIGRNGTGKSTLLKVLAGETAFDGGERFIQPRTTVAYLTQDPVPDGETVAHYVAADLHEDYKVATILDAMKLDGARDTATLSGGEGRRAALARALISEPDILLLDEPTNHLDLPTIEWLEQQIKAFRGALMVISHDRAFLANVSNRVVWLDRGRALTSPRGYAHFDDWAEEVEAEEARSLNRLNETLKAEAHWLARGVTARRKRNEGRLKRLKELRQYKADYVHAPGKVRMEAGTGKSSGKMVIEAVDLHKSFGETVVARGFSTRIMRGDRVGILGPNGAGKSTLLKMLIGEVEPDAGTVRLGANIELAYFDQHRVTLDPDLTPWETFTGGTGGLMTVRGESRHVASYLKDFLFREEQFRTPIHALSGGERNRLLIAKLLAQPSNLLVLDEPTNDLDMDTLSVLEDMLSAYDGTLILVSHDRDFLDQVVTSTIAVEGGGEVMEYPGGYSDYVIQRGEREETPQVAVKKSKVKPDRPKATAKLSYKDQRQLDQLPGTMEGLRKEITALEETLSDPTLFTRSPEVFDKATHRLTQAQGDLETAEERWLELEMMREALEG